jgi:hypothetical protein
VSMVANALSAQQAGFAKAEVALRALQIHQAQSPAQSLRIACVSQVGKALLVAPAVCVMLAHIAWPASFTSALEVPPLLLGAPSLLIAPAAAVFMRQTGFFARPVLLVPTAREAGRLQDALLTVSRSQGPPTSMHANATRDSSDQMVALAYCVRATTTARAVTVKQIVKLAEILHLEAPH